MNELLILIGALGTNSVISALVGILGSRRTIGFGWAFLISAIFTPIVGIIAVLLSDTLPYGERRWGCIAPLFILIAIAMILAFFSIPIL